VDVVVVVAVVTTRATIVVASVIIHVIARMQRWKAPGQLVERLAVVVADAVHGVTTVTSRDICRATAPSRVCRSATTATRRVI